MINVIKVEPSFPRSQLDMIDLFNMIYIYFSFD